jgi:arylformamidase
MFMTPPTKGPSIIAFGGDEYDEFDRQASDLAAAWATHGVPTSTLNLPGRDHFTALSALAEPDHALFAAALKLLGLR